MAWPYVGRDFATLLRRVLAGERVTHPEGDPYRLIKEVPAKAEVT